MTEERKTILLVDDDMDFRLQQKALLEQLGFVVEEADSRVEGEALLARRRPALAVIDLMMDEPDAGFSLCHAIKKAYPDVPVIIVTAVTSETGLQFDSYTDEERRWVKADALLAKPVRFEQLRLEIDRLLGVKDTGHEA